MVSKNLMAASTKPLILTILAPGEMYGYQIIQSIIELSGGTLEWSEGMLYPVLHRLEKQELIESFWENSETGRKRKYYRIKDSGQKALKEQQAQWKTVYSAMQKLWEAKPCLT